MEDFYNSPLIQSIKDKIKTNNNKGITGNILQEELLKIVSALDLGGMFLGFASKSTNPGNEGKSRANGFYFSTEEGTYTNFIGSNNQPLVIGSDLEIIYREVINDTLTWNHRSIASQFSVSGEENNFASFDGNGGLQDSGKNAGSFAAVLVVNSIEQLTSEQIEGLKVGDVVSAREFGTLTQEMTNFTVHSKSVESCRLESMSKSQAVEVAYTKENNLWAFEYSRAMAFEDLADIDLSNLSGDGEARFDAKADKVSEATNGNFAGLDSNGNITDSGYKADDFVQNITRGGSTLTKTNGIVDIPEEIENVVATPVAAGGNPTVNLTNGTLTLGLPSGEDAYNPFKGTYLITDTLPTTGQAGDYIYVVDSQTPPVTHLYTWDGSAFADSGETVTMGDSQFANSTKPISQTNVVNDLTTGGTEDVLSAEQGKELDALVGRVREYVNMTDLVQGGITGSQEGIPNNSTSRVRTKYFLTGHIKVETLSDDIVFIEYIYNLDGTYRGSTVDKASDEINDTTKLYVIVFKKTDNTDVTPDYVKERVTFNSVVKDIVDLNGDIADLDISKLDKSYPIYETSPLTATDTQYQTGYFINYHGSITATSNFGVLGFDCTENQELLITGSFGSGPNCLGVFKDDNGNVKGLVLQKPNDSPYNSTVVSDYYCEVPSGATKIYVQTNKNLLTNPSCKLVINTTYRQYSEIILQNETDIDSIQSDLEQLQDDFNESIYTEVTIPQTWVNRMVLSSLVVGEAPNFVSNSSYSYCYVEGLEPGEVVNAHFRAGSSYKYGAKLKNGVIVATFTQNETTLDRTYVVDDTFDAIILNNYNNVPPNYTNSPTAEVITTANRFSLIEDNIEVLQETVNDIIEQGVGGEFNLLCFGNSFTQDTISYIPWLIKECEPNLKLNVYFTYMGGMPISQCLAYISNGTTIALDANGIPTTKYENYGGWDRIYSYSNGEWVAPEEGTTNYHKSYTLYKYDDGTSAWVSQSEPTATSVLQMKNWDLITIQQGGSINYRTWDYYFKPYVYQIQAELQKQVKHNFTLGYLMTHASYATTSEALLEHYNGIIQNTTKMLENTPVEIIMPYATALQNARTTYLDRFGAGGHLMGDTAHVSDGVGCLTCAYANAMAILDLIGSKKSIVGSQIYPDAAWLSSHNIPAVSSTIEGLSRYNIWLAQQCAVMADKYPLQLTDMVAKGMCGDIEIEIVNDTVYSSNPILSANNGDTWKTTLVAPDGMAINSVSIVMGSTDITSSVYDNSTHIVNIPNVSNKITITATLTQ